MLHDILMFSLIIFVILLCVLVYKIYDFVCDLQWMNRRDYDESKQEVTDAE